MLLSFWLKSSERDKHRRQTPSPRLERGRSLLPFLPDWKGRKPPRPRAKEVWKKRSMPFFHQPTEQNTKRFSQNLWEIMGCVFIASVLLNADSDHIIPRHHDVFVLFVLVILLKAHTHTQLATHIHTSGNGLALLGSFFFFFLNNSHLVLFSLFWNTMGGA